MADLYQIGVPIEGLSTVIALWGTYECPCKLVISPAKTEDMAVVELRDMRLAADIIKNLPDSRVRIVNQAVKTVTI